ncbi:matrix-remodeling-associated protein 7-like [Centruroides vittatus]|uniref:matrix-remodeling-associated protein 7-like n=1 Tax=Centruroides vittatus TaxID=120091 RepID=UPI00350FA1AA
MVDVGLAILYDSLTSYYLVSVLTTVAALLGTYWLCRKKNVQQPASTKPTEESIKNKNLIPEVNDEIIDKESSKEVNKPARIAEMVINAGLTEQQKQEEKEVQKQQLSEIFRLMQEQADKFGVTTMSDVEEQMKLYR